MHRGKRIIAIRSAAMKGDKNGRAKVLGPAVDPAEAVRIKELEKKGMCTTTTTTTTTTMSTTSTSRARARRVSVAPRARR